jgi:hypothetical protein
MMCWDKGVYVAAAGISVSSPQAQSFNSTEGLMSDTIQSEDMHVVAGNHCCETKMQEQTLL